MKHEIKIQHFISFYVQNIHVSYIKVYNVLGNNFEKHEMLKMVKSDSNEWCFSSADARILFREETPV